MANATFKNRVAGLLMAGLIVWTAVGLAGCGTTSSASPAASGEGTPSASAPSSGSSHSSAPPEKPSKESSSAASSAESAEASESSSTSSAASDEAAGTSAEVAAVQSTMGEVPTKDALTTEETIANSANGEHAIQASSTAAEYANVLVQKTGDSDSGDEADFYGDNAAVFATDGATLNLSGMVVETDGTHANGVFSYGEGTTVNIVDSVIETSGNCSGGLMTTGGATMNATNLNIATSGNSSAAIRSDRGGGIVTVTGGTYTTSGKGSPAIYSTADITVNDAKLESTSAQGVVVEGKNSVTLNNVDLVASNTSKNSDKSDFYQAVMIYQSMSGDADSGQSHFAMNGGTLTNANGDVFFVNNTSTTIDLSGASIVNNGGGAFLRAAAAGWGNEGSNGGKVVMTATGQAIDGDMLVDDVSLLNLYLAEGSTFTGAINPDGAQGDVYVELSGGSTWTLTGDSHISALTCDAGAVNLNGHTLYVGNAAYDGTSASTGEAIEVPVSESTGHGSGDEGAPSGEPPAKPEGEGGHGGHGGTPPSKPSATSSDAS